MTITKKGYTWIFVVTAVFVAVVILYVYRDKIFGSKVPKPTEPVPQGSHTTNWVPESFPLDLGMYGPNIKKLQKALGIKEDGKFGNIETKPTLIAKGYVVPLSEADYNKIVGIKTTTTSNYKGKNAYANKDGVKVFNNLDNSIYKTAKSGEWVGVVTDIDSQDDHYYLIASGTRSVKRTDVYLQ